MDVETTDLGADAPSIVPDGGDPPPAATPAPDGKATEGGPETLAEGKTTPVQVTANFPDNWQELVADDPNDLKTLSRFKTPKDLWKRAKEATAKISSGKFIELPGKDATEEQRAAFNKALGVPETPDQYIPDGKLPSGKVIGEGDMPRVEAFTERMHKLGAPPAVVQEALDAYFDLEQAAVEERAVSDADYRVQSEVALKQEYGGNYDGLTKSIGIMLSNAPPEIQDVLLHGRGGDGNIIGNHPVVVKWLGELATALYPQETLTPMDEGERMSLEEEIAKYQKLIGNDSSEYWTGPSAKRHQDRFAKLLEIQKKQQARAA